MLQTRDALSRLESQEEVVPKSLLAILYILRRLNTHRTKKPMGESSNDLQCDAPECFEGGA